MPDDQQMTDVAARERFHLYYSHGLASLAPHLILNELDLPHELHFVDRTTMAHKSPDYMKLNPNGRIPTLIHGDVVLFESAAICMYIVESVPGVPLVPAFGSWERPHFYKWLIFLTNTLQENLWHFYRPEFYVEDARYYDYRATMESHILKNFALLDRQLDGRGTLLCDLTIPDFYLFMLCTWARIMETPPRTFPHITTFMESMLQRPSVQKVLPIEQLAPPLY